jgi:Carboxypeptidase regulatory-like domain
MKQIFALLVASIVTSACGQGGSGSLAPTAPASSATGAFTVSGGVAEADGGLPLRGVRVVVSNGIERLSVLSDSSGNYSVQGIPSGPWTVTVSKSGYESESIDADVTTDMTLSFELSLGGSRLP